MFAAGAGAQRVGRPDPKMWKEIQEYKLKFLAQEMELKKDQQQKFFDLYTEMSEKKKALFDGIRQAEEELKNKKDPTEKDYEEASRRITEAKEKDAKIEKEYDAKFSKFLTKQQIYQMKSGEEKFRLKMHKMRHNGRRHKSPKADAPLRPSTK